jgi:hypothetical protein
MIGDILSSTLLTLFIVPVAYTLMSVAHFAFNRLRARIPFLARRQTGPAERDV